MDASQAARSPLAISSASSRNGLSVRQRSALSGGMMPYGDGRRVLDRMMQIEAGLLPATLNGPFRSAAHDCDVSEENPQKNFKSTISARSGSTLASSSSASPISSSACDSETLSGSSVPSEEISNNPLAAATAGRQIVDDQPRITRAM